MTGTALTTRPALWEATYRAPTEVARGVALPDDDSPNLRALGAKRIPLDIWADPDAVPFPAPVPKAYRGPTRLLVDSYVTFLHYETSYASSAAGLFVLFGSTDTTSDTASGVITIDPLAGYEQYEVADWDGYGAEAITRETLTSARNLLNILPAAYQKPEIAPGSDGGVGFEWIWKSGPVRKLFIDVGPGKTWSAYWRLSSGQKGSLPRQEIGPRTAVTVIKIFGELGLADVVVRR